MEILYVGIYSYPNDELKHGGIPLDGSCYEHAYGKVMLPDRYLRFECYFKMLIGNEAIMLIKQKDLCAWKVSDVFSVTNPNLSAASRINYNTLFSLKRSGDARDINYILFCNLGEDEAFKLKQFYLNDYESSLLLDH